MGEMDVELLFLGTGTSAGVPMIGCKCATCLSTDPHDKRTRPSVVISYGGLRVLVDSTPELRLQCLANQVDSIDAVVYTHAHADHIMGLDDLRRFNAIRNGPLDVWADQKTHEKLTQCFGYAFKEPKPENTLFRPRLVRRMIDGPFEIGPLQWTPVPLMHGDDPILGFRVGSVAYCTDVSLIPEDSYPLLEALDVLVLDALHHHKHETHFSVAEAVEAAQRIKAKQTYFTHMTHNMPHAATNATLPETIQLGHDGLRVTAQSGKD
jgi:phosphoribosyl 1,2-cyclic phosphate phosphodiesterase